MPRYMVERVFPDGLNVPVDATGAQALGKVVQTNAEQGVTWVHSYVSADKTRTFCIYDGPRPTPSGRSPNAIHYLSRTSRKCRCWRLTSTIDGAPAADGFVTKTTSWATSRSSCARIRSS